MNEDKWGVWCEVNGSMGFREAWLKTDDGMDEWSGTEAEAREKAAYTQSNMGKHSTASFRYTPEPRVPRFSLGNQW